MKRIVFTLIFDNDPYIVGDSQNVMHNALKGNQDYIDSNIVVSTDVPYDGESFEGDESQLTVDLRDLENPKETLYTALDAFGAVLKETPSIIGKMCGKDDMDNIPNRESVDWDASTLLPPKSDD